MSAYQKITYACTPEEKQLYWNIGIGLQAVDSLKPSKYLVEQQEKEVQGETTLDDVERNLRQYYELRQEEADLTEKEADFSSLRINEYLRRAEFRLHPLALKQIHPFKEGNTRAIAVFTIQYLNTLGYQISNEPFEKHAAYFRDALVRVSYNDMIHKISPDHSYLNRFFENVIQGKQHLLKSEDLIIQITEHEPQQASDHEPQGET